LHSANLSAGSDSGAELQVPVVTSGRRQTAARECKDGHDRLLTAFAKPVRAWKDFSMDDQDILGHIDELIATEHDLRRRLAAGELTTEDEQQQLRAVEEQLDQCWDLLRQRRARREYGEDPSGSAARPVTEVEGYLQ
jgi:hypothetical protein